MIRRRPVTAPLRELIAGTLGRRRRQPYPNRAVLVVELTPTEWDMFQDAADFTVAPSDRFEVRWPHDDAALNPYLECITCGERVAEVEGGDMLDILNDSAAAHRCLRTRTGHVITVEELGRLAEEADLGYDVTGLPKRPRLRDVSEGGYADSFRRSALADRIRGTRLPDDAPASAIYQPGTFPDRPDICGNCDQGGDAHCHVHQDAHCPGKCLVRMGGPR